MLATEYARYYEIGEQQEGESDMAFKGRVAGVLRDKGKLIEAHEAQQDARCEESDAVNTGIMGALAQMMQGVDYHVSGEQQIGVDIAAGTVVQNPRRKMSPKEALLAMALLEGTRR